MSNLDVSLACAPTDRTRAVLDGAVVPEGIDLQPVPLEAERASRRMLAHEEFQAAEVSLAGYLRAADAGGPPLVGIPVFPARSFVHSLVFAGDEGDDLADLAGARVGVTEPTAALWLRGILADRHDVEPGDVDWVRARDADPTHLGDVPHEVVPSDRTPAGMLEAGDLDALVTTEPPGTVGRFLGDSRSAERDYYRETGHFPILDVVVVRRALYERHPWVAQELYKALDTAKDRCLAALGGGLASTCALPWLGQEVEATRALMGEDYWPYGVGANEATVETAARYAHEQGLTERELAVEDLFAPETFEAFKV